MAVFKGLSAFPLTPADGDGVVDTQALAAILERLVAAQVDSIGLLGSTGIYAYLSREERRRAVRLAVETVKGRVPLIVGAGALRTDAAIALARDAAEAGADALLIAPVSYMPLRDDEVWQHFVAISAATDLPICIYNNPGTTHFTFSPQLLGRLSALPRVAAVKMPPPAAGTIVDQLAELRRRTANAMAIGFSADWILADALLAGADGFYSALGGMLPNEVMPLARAAQSGNVSETARIGAAFEPFWPLFREFGGLRVNYHIAHRLMLTEAQPPLPVLPLPREAEWRADEALQAVLALNA